MKFQAVPGSTAGRIVAIGYMVTLAVTYSLVVSLNRIATTAGVPFIPYVFWQVVGAGLLLLTICAVRRRWPPITRDSLISYGMVGLFGFAIAFSVLAAAAPNAPASVISLTLTMTPVLVYVFAVVIGMDRFYWLRALGIASSFAGVLLVLVPPLLQNTSALTADMVPWVVLAFGAPLCYSIANLSAARFRPPDAGGIEMGAGVLVAATIFLIPVMAVDGSWWFFDEPIADGSWTIFIALIVNALFMVLMYEVLRLAGPVIFSTYNYIATLCGMGWAALLFADIPSALIWASVALLFTGLYLVNRPRKAVPVKEGA
ncbi:MAG: DMT family transporter [Alphaproteobacteria bacterium]|nr:DMT family transporter [Alphaproteobacteria bacterium]